jgi:hypothetical protein
MAVTDDLPGPSRAGQPGYRREITAEPAEPIIRQPGEPLPPHAIVTGPQTARLHPDPDVARRPGPECRDSAGIMDADRAARALGRRREHVEAAVREQAAREAQLGEWARQETARQADAGGPQLAGAALDAETGRLAEAYPEPRWTGRAPGLEASASVADAWEQRAWAAGEREHPPEPADALEPGPPRTREEEIAELTANGWYSAPVEEVAAPGDEPGVDAARWVPGQERDQLEVAGELLRRHAAEAADAFRRERHATAYERFAQRVHDPELLELARDIARNARTDRRTATKDAYLAAASLQRSALGPEPEDTGGFYQRGADYIGWSPDVTSPTAEHQLEAG